MKKILIGNFKGPPGVQGRSAYQVAVNEGYVGSEAQWIESLHSIVPGPKGETGIQGYQGASITGLVFNADGSISVSIHDPKTNTDSTIAAGNALTSSLLAQMQQYVNNAGSSANAAAASQSAAKMSENNSALSAENASMSATASANSAASAAESAADAQAVTQGQKGYFETDTALKTAHPTGQVGWWAIVGSTDTIWVWDDTTSTWLNSGNQTDLSNYYTKTQADAEFPAGTIVLESEDPTLVPLNADTLGGQASNYYCKAADIGNVSNLTTTAKTVVPAINENKASIDTLNQNLPRVLHGTTQLNVSPYIGHVTFATPMSNTDYVIILTPRCTSALTGGEPAYGPAVFNKTVNGFDYTSGGAASTTGNWYVDWTVIY